MLLLRVQAFQSTALHAQFLAGLKNDVFQITQASQADHRTGRFTAPTHASLEV